MITKEELEYNNHKFSQTVPLDAGIEHCHRLFVKCKKCLNIFEYCGSLGFWLVKDGYAYSPKYNYFHQLSCEELTIRDIII